MLELSEKSEKISYIERTDIMLQLKKILNNSVSTLFRILIAVISVFILISKFIPYNEYFKRNLVFSNAILMLLGIILLSLLYRCFEHFDFPESKTKRAVIHIVFFWCSGDNLALLDVWNRMGCGNTYTRRI